MKDQNKIGSMFRGDSLLLIVFTALAALMVIFVVTQVMPLIDSAVISTVVVVVAAVSMTALCGCAVAVLVHLKKNRDEVYGEDIHYQNLIRAQKEEQK